MKFITLASTVPFASVAYGVACPFEAMKRSGLLNEAEAAKFEAVKRDPSVAEELFQVHRREAEASPAPQGLGSPLGLPLGGGLLNGALQPLTGPLAALDIPTPQPQGLAPIGQDPDHLFQAPGPTDVRGICPTLNALANHGYISRDGVNYTF